MKRIFYLIFSVVFAWSFFAYPVFADQTISITDNAFLPDRLEIKVGTRVTWVQNGQRSHTVTSDDVIFESGNLNTGKTFSYVFSKPGIYKYYCLYHGDVGGVGMSGTVVVTEDLTPPPVTPPPINTPPPSTTPPPASPPVDKNTPTGTLALEKGTIFFLMGKDKTKVPFTSMTAFTGLGYTLKNVVKMDLSGYKSSGSYFLNSPSQAHPWGSWLLYKSTIYYVHETGLIGVPTWDIFVANGGSPWLVLPLNAADDAAWAANPNLPPLIANDYRLY